MKTNFRKIESQSTSEIVDTPNIEEGKTLTPAEFEEYVVKSGAKGSFMVYRSEKEDEELGIDEL